MEISMIILVIASAMIVVSFIVQSKRMYEIAFVIALLVTLYSGVGLSIFCTLISAVIILIALKAMLYRINEK